MPYSGADDKDLPENVKKLSKKQRKQWVEIFNSTIKDGGDESKAFRYANGVIKKQAKAWIESWNVYDSQVSQADSEYNALGASNTQGCANCNWFISPDGCILVNGTVSPTGICKFWLEPKKWEPSPMEVVIVGDETKELDEEGIVSRIKSFLSSLGIKGLAPDNDNEKESVVETAGEIPFTAPQPPVQYEPDKLYFIKQADERIRFFTIFSNNFKDRENETITEEAHKEFADWTEQTKQFPELHLWHCGKSSKWGAADWIDYTNGFICASGLVDKEKEYIAEKLEKEDIGVSHGFIGLSLPGTKSIIRYRSFEISPLPRWASANSWTNFATDIGDFGMPFSDKRKTWLKNISGLNDEQISAWEQDVDKLSGSLKDMGVEFKDNEEASQTVLVQSMAKALTEMAEMMKKFKGELDEAKTSLDDRVAQVFTAEIAKLPNGFVASKSKDTEVPPEERKNITPPSDWFGDVVLKSLKDQ